MSAPDVTVRRLAPTDSLADLTTLLEHAEARARELGAAELACDTAEPATHLVAFYERRGYRVVDRADWEVVNYESLILAKRL